MDVSLPSPKGKLWGDPQPSILAWSSTHPNLALTLGKNLATQGGIGKP